MKKNNAQTSDTKKKGTKIVIIGAGSRAFGHGSMVDILECEELQHHNTTLTLVDINEPALELMTKLAVRIKKYLGSDIVIESTTNRRAALKGANYVITSVTLKRHELWELDYRIPRALGFNHIYGENGGPGAMFHALRNLELVIPICRDVEEICPDALLLNFTNPEARILHGICHLTKVKAVGLCHGYYGALDFITKYLKKNRKS